ncbi:DUF3068 domain-containing protein [Actinomadura sp. DC4]|uniref:DUF3068 domain-containing protein n=1 Tax=Actinomadura sp. DC4 TaxID=3055069 RepID=UPI0025B1F8D2|nr:DUF3068 domain-containing protein [Actinomadura sp. DC4]MDN3357584.1 DUF3068 domain-containing protein [Actinomadura sp. DC4]
MRRVIGLTLIGFGAFLLAGGVLIRYYVAPRVIQAPTDTYQVTTLQAQNAAYFDAASLRIRTGATVTATNTVRGDPRASHGGTAVWDSFTAIEDPANNVSLDVQRQRLAFDRRDARLTNCCGVSVQGDPKVRQSGIGLFWPVDVKKRTYQLFDLPTRRTWPIAYDGEERVNGVRAYRFVQHVPDTRVVGAVPPLPGELLGLGAKSGTVTADRYYQADVTYWIDPRTGAPLNQREKVLSTLRSRTGGGRLVVADLDLRMVARSQRQLLDKADDGARSISVVTFVIPLVCVLVGLVSIACGALTRAQGRRADRARPAAAEPVPAE